jgi:hypothetical protein
MKYSKSAEKQADPTTTTQPQPSSKGAKKNPDTFSRFLELPKELRLSIVEEHLPAPNPRTTVMYCNKR